MKHLYFFNKFFESFTNNLNKDGWLEFGDTSSINNNTFNSWDHFRNGRKRINPQKTILNEAENILKKYLNNKIVNLKWESEFRQLYCYMYNKKSHMTYKESEESNKKLIIVNFYDDNWIMCSITDENDVRKETHFVCDDIFGFENFIKSKSNYLVTKY